MCIYNIRFLKFLKKEQEKDEEDFMHFSSR